MLATILDSFQGADMSRQLGGAWWFNQTKSGIEAQLTTLAEQQVLGDSIGMATEATTLFSYPRQEYFRRILCNFIGNLVERGEFPADFDDLRYDRRKYLLPQRRGISALHCRKRIGIDIWQQRRGMG